MIQAEKTTADRVCKGSVHLNQKLKDQLNSIKDLGQKIMALEDDLSNNKARRSAIAEAGTGLTHLPTVKKALENALAALDAEIADEEEEIHKLKDQLSK